MRSEPKYYIATGPGRQPHVVHKVKDVLEGLLRGPFVTSKCGNGARNFRLLKGLAREHQDRKCKFCFGRVVHVIDR